VLKSWYVSRFLALREPRSAIRKSYFHRYSRLSTRRGRTATSIWSRSTSCNPAREHLADRQRADLILTKGESHRFEQVRCAGFAHEPRLCRVALGLWADCA
jgi:type I pantothenate kinase